MQMQIENPYLKQKSELVIMIDRLKLRLASENTDRLKAELVSAEELLHNVEAKSREFNAQILSSFNSEVEKVITKSIRHGDLGLFLIDELPKGLKKSDSKVLLKGSHGNEHYVDKGVFYPYQDGFIIGYLVANEKCKLLHIGHGKEINKNKPKEVQLEKGVYELRQQHEIRHSSMEAVID